MYKLIINSFCDKFHGNAGCCSVSEISLWDLDSGKWDVGCMKKVLGSQFSVESNEWGIVNGRAHFVLRSSSLWLAGVRSQEAQCKC